MSIKEALWALTLGLGCPNICLALDAGGALPGGDFEQGLTIWTQNSSSGGAPFVSIPGPADGEGALAAGCDLSPGIEASLELLVPIAAGAFVASAPPSGVPGRKLEFGAWVWLEAGAGNGEVWLELHSEQGAASTRLAASEHWSVDQAPKSRWLFLATQPDAINDGRVPTGAQRLRYSLHTSASGLVVFDGARVRDAQREELRLLARSFESWTPGDPGWTSSGQVSAGPTAQSSSGYYGPGHALLESTPDSALSQELPSAARVGELAALAAGQFVEAGCWLRFEDQALLPQAPSALTFVELSVFARSATSNVERLVANARWSPTLSQAGHWVHLKTAALQPLELDETLLRVHIRRSINASLALDFVQLGERNSIDGNPRRRVGSNYVGRYRAPQFPSNSSPPDAAGRWRNWHWQVPPACSANFEGFFHSPDCATSADCVRANGRRNLASSPKRSIHDLPLVGSYDSRDPEILRYHLGLAAGAGIDHFIFDYQGHAIAQQELVQGREPINEATYEALLKEANRPGVDIKLATMYEPKVHFQGWVLGQPSKAAKLAGITADLVFLARAMAGQRAAMRHNNRLVVFLFRNKICTPDGSQCMLESDWLQVQLDVFTATGENLFLVGDSKPDPGSALEGFTRWQLVDRDLLVHRTWSDVRDGIATLPVPQLARLVGHSRGLAQSVRNWQAQDDAARVAVLTVWPGFDDSGVGGWGQYNLPGEDGQALCVRVADDFDGDFYTTTVASALEQNADWVQIATWNDWNEATRIEPAWHPDYLAPLPVGQNTSALVDSQVFGRLRETKQWIEAFKGQPAPGASFRSIAGRYLSRAERLPGVPLYD